MATELCVSLEEYFSQLFKADAPHCLKLVFEPLSVLISSGRPVRLATNPADLSSSAVVQEQFVVFLLFISYLDCYMHGTAGMLSRSPEVEAIEVLVGSQGWRRSSDVRACIERWSQQHAPNRYQNEALRGAVEVILSEGFIRDPSNIAKRDKGDIRFPYMCSGGRPKICGERSSKLAELSCIPPSCGRNKGCRLGFQPVSDLLQATYTVFEKLDSKTRTAVKPLIGDLLLELDGKGMRVEGVPEAVRAAVAALMTDSARGWIVAVDWMDQWREAAQQSAVLAGLRGPEDAPLLLAPLEALLRMQAAKESSSRPPLDLDTTLNSAPIRRMSDEEAWGDDAARAEQALNLSSFGFPQKARQSPDAPEPGDWVSPVPGGAPGVPTLRPSPMEAEAREAAPNPWAEALAKSGLPQPMPLPSVGAVGSAAASFGKPAQPPLPEPCPRPALAPSPFADGIEKGMNLRACEKGLTEGAEAAPPFAPASGRASNGPDRAMMGSDVALRQLLSSSVPHAPHGSSRVEPAFPSALLSSGPQPPAGFSLPSDPHPPTSLQSDPQLPARALPQAEDASHRAAPFSASALLAAQLLRGLTSTSADVGACGSGSRPDWSSIERARLPTAGAKRPREEAAAGLFGATGAARAEADEEPYIPEVDPDPVRVGPAGAQLPAAAERAPAHAVEPAPAAKHQWTASASVKRETAVYDFSGTNAGTAREEAAAAYATETRVHDSARSEETGVHASGSGAGAPPPAKAARLSGEAGAAAAPSAPRPRSVSAAPSPPPSTADVTLDLKTTPELLQAMGTIARYFTAAAPSSQASDAGPSSVLPLPPNPNASAMLRRLQEALVKAANLGPGPLAQALSALDPIVSEVEERLSAPVPSTSGMEESSGASQSMDGGGGGDGAAERPRGSDGGPGRGSSGGGGGGGLPEGWPRNAAAPCVPGPRRQPQAADAGPSSSPPLPPNPDAAAVVRSGATARRRFRPGL
ncbi:hypothetical protein HYH03_001039 [Edaphochlamys debaryana]|uniref:Uncharacterized protein n=1 Tax=Edaphochlamys debaryana TaxID=47281 RepID=A0A835YGD1_9CHLO|nr:hypothetical protein HYH03_001039 [Edaphochlamys debaryana]|eukprot:KAG2501232.1 hypothetical protein HYH03_001039 [Edaphochlamys debaryana]